MPATCPVGRRHAGDLYKACHRCSYSRLISLAVRVVEMRVAGMAASHKLGGLLRG